MKIGILSDSHIPSSTRRLPEQVLYAFDGVDLILHCGDIYIESALDHLETLAPVMAVGHGLDLDIERVETKRVIELGGITIGMVHILTIPKLVGEVFPGRIEKAPPLPIAEGLTKVFGRRVNACLFGDTHYEVLEHHEGILFLNPGSPTLPRQMMRLGTVAILEIDSGRLTPTLVDLKDLRGPAPVYT